ncbi:MAG: hypothetical protein K1X72_23255 [Pyrinomonadaceae bacterium]|nr:hypothetical protein [Pyrinomonadaceae bacterium]
MDGVILFVDDRIHKTEADGRTPTLERSLFEALRNEHPVLGVHNLDLAENAIKSIGSFSAIILDWIYEDTDSFLLPGEKTEDLGSFKPPRTGTKTLEFLQRNEFYSPIYVFSNEDVENEHGKELKKRYSKRIKFRKKKALHGQAKKIAKDIIKWKEHNKNLAIPLIWTKTINQSVQKILLELSAADKNWIRELGKTANDDGVEGNVFVIEILQNLLAESLVQNSGLINSIRDHINSDENELTADDRSVSKLFKRLFYTKLNEDSPIMTGDICRLNSQKFGIIITPECDISDITDESNKTFELLTFTKQSFDDALAKLNSFSRNLYDDWKKRNKLAKVRQHFNNGDAKFHILPSFPFNNSILNQPALVDFSLGTERYKFGKIAKKRIYKLNSPYIQQLRQRYLAYLGRVGVPGLPVSVRDHNLRDSK